MRVAVTGSTGLIGGALLGALREAGHEPVPVVRREPEPGEIGWDPAAGTLDTDGLSSVDAVVALSGANIGRRWSAAVRREGWESRVGTVGLLAASMATMTGGPRTLVCMSATGYYGDRGDEILDETATRGEGFLAKLAEAWEAAAAPARDAGIRVAHLRTGIVLDGEGGALPRMLTPFRLGVGGKVGSGRQWWSWLALDDVSRAFLHVLDGDLEGPVNVTAPNPVRNEDFVKALGTALRRPTVLPAPAFALKAVYGQMAEEALLSSERVVPARLTESGFAFSYPELDAALARALGQ